jgi:hypothetical protein
MARHWQFARLCAATGKAVPFAITLYLTAPGIGFAQDADRAAMPRDVRAFMDRRDQCDHFRNEEIYDDARAAEIEKGVTEFCTGTDAELVSLKRRHSLDESVTQALSSYGADIE